MAIKLEDYGIENFGQLQESVEYSRTKLKPFRDNQMNALKQYVGSHYSEHGAEDKVPINMIELAVNIYLQNLAASRPKALVSTVPLSLKGIANKLEIETNNTLGDMIFEDILEGAVLQAIFSVGIIKTYLTQRFTVNIDGDDYPVTEPLCANVTLDNWVHDMSARVWSEMQFCGDRCTMLYEEAVNDETLDKEFREKLTAMENKAQRENDENRAEKISQGDEPLNNYWKDVCELWNIWLPKQKVVLVMAEDIDIPGKVIRWKGRPTGPYRFLKFNNVIDNVMPLPPVSLWLDLHELTNILYRKLGRQAERQKTIVGVQAGADADGNRIVKANDGDMIKLDNPQAAKEYKFGGVDQQSLLFLMQTKELMSYMAGNLDAMGGLSRQSDTVGQDQLLTSNANKRLVSMQKRTIRFATDVIEDIAWYRWTDPIREYPVTIRKYNTEAPDTLTIRERETDFFKYNFTIEPFSLQSHTPEQKLSSMINVLERLYAPYAETLAQRGIFLDFEKLYHFVAKYGNLPELKELIIVSEPQIPQEQPQGKSVRTSPVTTRKYERIGKPGATREGNDRQIMQMLTGNLNRQQPGLMKNATG